MAAVVNAGMRGTTHLPHRQCRVLAGRSRSERPFRRIALELNAASSMFERLGALPGLESARSRLSELVIS
jgi:hypothetical protein